MKIITSLVLLAVVGGASYFGYQYWMGHHQINQKSAADTATPKPVDTPEVKHPVPEEAAAATGQAASTSVPRLDSSDQSLEAVFANLFGAKALGLFNMNELIRRIVATVEGATGTIQPAEEMTVFKPLETEFAVKDKGLVQTIAPENFQRYQRHIALVKALDVEKLVAFYIRFYPLFQSAYEELGTKKYFNDRLIEVIDSALQAPEPAGLIEVARPTEKYRHKFIDERLENLNIVQKVLVRMGVENARVVKGKLRLIRARLVVRGK